MALTAASPLPRVKLWIPVMGFNARYLKGAVCVAEEWPLKAAEFKSGAPRSSMRLRQITVAPTFAANQRAPPAEWASAAERSLRYKPRPTMLVQRSSHQKIWWRSI